MQCETNTTSGRFIALWARGGGAKHDGKNK